MLPTFFYWIQNTAATGREINSIPAETRMYLRNQAETGASLQAIKM